MKNKSYRIENFLLVVRKKQIIFLGVYDDDGLFDHNKLFRFINDKKKMKNKSSGIEKFLEKIFLDFWKFFLYLCIPWLLEG